MAAFCGCCGAEITPKAETCSVCGTPRHGMAFAPDSLAVDDLFESASQNVAARPDPQAAGPRKQACCARF
jgi:hypothetical protein